MADEQLKDPSENGEDKAFSAEELAEIKHVKNVMKNFENAEKNHRLYPPNNVNVLEAIGHFTTSLSIFFNKFEKPLKMKVTQTKFLFNNQTVYQNAEKDKSLSFRIYVDGVRAINFKPGCEEKEAKELMEVFLELSMIDPLENDFVSLFWEKEFEYIDIATTELFKQDAMESQSDFTFERDFSNAIPGAETLGADFSVELNQLKNKSKKKRSEQSIEEQQIVRSREDIFLFSGEEQQDIRELVEESENYDPIFDFIDIVFRLFSMEQDPEMFSNIVTVIGKTVQGFVKRYQFGNADNILTRARDYMQKYSDSINSRQADSVTKMIRGLGDSELVDAVKHELKSSKGEKLDNLFSFLSNLEPSIVPDIFDTLIKSQYTQRVVKLLSTFGEGQFEFFKNRLYEYDNEVDVVLMDILAEIDIDKALPVFIEGISNENSVIRNKSINTLMKYDNQQVKDVFRKAVTDADESNQIMALRYFNKHKEPDVFPVLSDIFKSRDFMENKKDKQQYVIGAMIKADRQKSFEIIQEVLKKKPLLKRKKYIKFQKYIIDTLSGIDSLDVAGLLLELIEKGSIASDLKEKCRSAVSKISSRSRNGN